MPLTRRHTVRRTSIRLRLQQTEQAASVQQAVNRMFREEVLPALSLLFDELIPPDQILRLPQLAVDLGVLSPDIAGHDWRERCCLALREALKEHLSTQISAGKVENLFVPREQGTWESWLFFLKTGRLPWWSPVPDQEKWEFELLTALQASTPGRADTLKWQLRSDIQQLERLVRQFSPAFLQMLLWTLWPELVAMVEEIKTLLRRSPAGSPAALRTLLQRLFASALRQTPDLTIRQYSTAMAGFAARSEAPDMAALLKAWDALERNAADAQPEGAPDSAQADNRAENRPRKDEGKAPEEDAWYVDNAGLAIIAPFIAPLFRGLNMVGEDGLPDAPAKQRGVALLRYLTDGSENAPEHQLALEKILCGLPTDWPLEREIALTETEKNETARLLTAVIQHWTALGQCSIPGLQETFLQRKGRISRRPDGQWLLQPERKTVDILLDRLPWGYGIVQLPWMKEMLMVEW